MNLLPKKIIIFSAKTWKLFSTRRRRLVSCQLTLRFRRSLDKSHIHLKLFRLFFLSRVCVRVCLMYCCCLALQLSSIFMGAFFLWFARSLVSFVVEKFHYIFFLVISHFMFSSFCISLYFYYFFYYSSCVLYVNRPTLLCILFDYFFTFPLFFQQNERKKNNNNEPTRLLPTGFFCATPNYDDQRNNDITTYVARLQRLVEKLSFHVTFGSSELLPIKHHWKCVVVTF